MSYRPTSLERVANYMIERIEEWIPGHQLTTPQVGGSEGLRRVREMRENGINIEMRKAVHGTGYEYRMLP